MNYDQAHNFKKQLKEIARDYETRCHFEIVKNAGEYGLVMLTPCCISGVMFEEILTDAITIGAAHQSAAPEMHKGEPVISFLFF